MGLFPASTWLLTFALAPIVLVGTWFGTKLLSRLSQEHFDVLALLASIVASVSLVVR